MTGKKINLKKKLSPQINILHLMITITTYYFTVDEGKEWLNPSRDKNQGTHRRRKVDEKTCVASSCVTPAGTSNELDVQNGWEENTHTHTCRSPR